MIANRKAFDLISSDEAATIMGCSRGSLCKIARRNGWEVECRKEKGGHKKTFYHREDVAAYVGAHGQGPSVHLDNWKKMREWADSLQSMPSVEAIAAHTLGPYNVAEMEALIGARPCRGLEPIMKGWCKGSCMDVPQCWYRKVRGRHG